MIHFACICGEPFDVPESQAGDSFQCPTCKRLVDVPMLSDLGSINDDGTLKIDEPVRTRQTLVGKMQAFGQDDDLRNNFDDIVNSGVNPNEMAPTRSAPRYDPETGELVVPIEVSPDKELDSPDDIPLASPVLGYSNNAINPAEQKQNLKWWSMPWQLLSGLSLMAMIFVFAAHAFVVVMLQIPAFNILMMPVIVVIGIATISHYCNTIEDIGPHDMDDVPVYLRNVSLSDDITYPFFHFLIAAIYALAPLWIASICGLRLTMHQHLWIPMAFLGWAGFIFPAMLFTAICSGALQNLMPWRVISVILAAPAQYVLAAGAFWLASVAYVGALSQTNFMPVSTLQTAGATHINFMPIAVNLGIVLGLFAIAVYLMHLASAWLGLIYRTHYAKFNWVLQRHEPRHRNETTAKLLKMHREQQNPQHSAEAQARLDYIRRADAERRQGRQTARPAPVTPASSTRKLPRGFEV